MGDMHADRNELSSTQTDRTSTARSLIASSHSGNEVNGNGEDVWVDQVMAGLAFVGSVVSNGRESQVTGSRKNSEAQGPCLPPPSACITHEVSTAANRKPDIDTSIASYLDSGPSSIRSTCPLPLWRIEASLALNAGPSHSREPHIHSYATSCLVLARSDTPPTQLREDPSIRASNPAKPFSHSDSNVLPLRASSSATPIREHGARDQKIVHRRA